MSSAQAASELRGPSTASTSDEEVEGACVRRIRRASSASKLLYIKQYSDVELGRVPQTFNRHKLRSPPPLAPCPCLATVRHMTKDSVVPALTKKQSYMLARGGWPSPKWKIAGWDCWREFEADPLWVSTEAGPERPDPDFSATEHTVAVSQMKQNHSVYPQAPPAGPVSTSAATLSILPTLPRNIWRSSTFVRN